MAQVGRISGPLLQENLLRDGRAPGSTENNLTFRNTLNDTQLLFLDVNNSKIGVNTGTPTKELEVAGTSQTTNLIASTQANTPGFEITDSTFRVLLGDIYLNAADAVVMANMQNGTIRISDNIISTIESNADIDITPYGVGLPPNDGVVTSTFGGGEAAVQKDIFGEALLLTAEPSSATWIAIQTLDPGDAGIITDSGIDYPFTLTSWSSIDREEAVIDIPTLANGFSSFDITVTIRPITPGTTEVVNDLNVFGNIHSQGDITFDGTITLGDADTDNVTFESDISSDIIPDSNNTYNLGSKSKRWETLYTNLLNGRAAEVDGYTLNGVDLLTRHGGIIYVAQEGDDTNSGDHVLDPLATISAALSRADASGEQPFTILVSAGEYQEVLPLVVPANVSVIGQDIRNTVITPDTSSQSADVFHLNEKTTIANLTIKNYYYDSVNNTGYAFRFAPDAVMSERSPYIQNVTVLTSETTLGSSDAGRGAWIDGDELNAATVNKTMLFHSCTFISPGADVINMTNDVRVEWLNSFTYYANRGLYAFAGSNGGAELRSIGSANVYGTYGAVADGSDTLMYLIQHNFGYIGAGNKNDNNEADVIQANEIVELNSGQIHYVSTDQKGNFRVGDNFFVDLETGNSSITIDTGEIDSLSGLNINSPGGTTVISGSDIQTGNIIISDNDISAPAGDLNLEGATGTININSDTNIFGSLDIRDNFSFGGTLNIAGNQPGRDTAADRLTFNVDFTQDFKPHVTLTHSLGEAVRPWIEANLDRAEIDDVTIDENFITSSTSNANLDLFANGTGRIYVPNNNVQVNNNLDVNNTTDLQNTVIVNTLTQIGNRSQTGNYTLTDLNVDGNIDISSQVQLEEILFDGNVITTTTSNSDLELRANSIGKIVVPTENVQVNNNLSADNVFNNNNVNITLQTEFGSADISDVKISGNYISTNKSNSNLELRASSTGIINTPNSFIANQGLAVNTKTFLQDGNTTYEYGPELVTNGTFDANINGWAQSGGGSANDVNGNLQINTIGSARNVSQSITVEAGKTYEFTAQFRSVTNSNAFYLRIFESGIGTLIEWNETSGLTDNQVLTFSVEPVTNSIDIIFRAVDTIVEWDNVSLVEDIGLVTAFTPVEVNVTNITQTGNITQISNITQTGDTTVSGDLSVSNEFTKTNININNNVIRNTGEGLRPSNASNETESIPGIVQAIIAGNTAEDFVGQPEKNLVNFFIDNDYVDVNGSGTNTTSDYILYLQYISNGSTGNSQSDAFIKDVLDEILILETSTPGYFNSILFDGEYFNPNLEFRAAGSGKVVFSNPTVNIVNDLGVLDTLSAKTFIVNTNITSNTFTISDTTKIDDNYISTIISNANLELRSFEDKLVYIPSNNVVVDNNLTVGGITDIDNTSITGNIVQTGNRTQLGNMNVIGTVTVSTSNIQDDLQLDDVLINANVIESQDSNADLELLAQGTGIIELPGNNVQIDNNLTTDTLNAANISVDTSFTFEDFELSSDVQLFDNVITTTESNSNLELRTTDNSNILLQDIYVNADTFSTASSNIDLNATNLINITATGAIKIPVGTTLERQTVDSGIRFNSTNNVFEAFRDNNAITFNGVYSSNRNTSLVSHPTNDIINVNIKSVAVGSINSNGLSIHGLEVDDVFINQNIISTNVSNSDLDLRSNGSGKLLLDNININDNTITNTVDSVFELNNTLYGKVKFASNGAVRIPSGTNAERPSTVETGMTRWNTENELLEVWDGSTFITAAGTSATLSREEMDSLVLEYTLIFG